MPDQIKRVAVIGAGTMGASIAALVAGAGLPVLLLDVPPTKLTPEEEAKGLSLAHPMVRNRIVQGGFDRMRKARPANLYNESSATRITLGNTEDDFAKLAECDWIVEVIIEQLGPKQALMERLEAVRKPHAIVTTNTSGIPIAQIAAGRSPEFKAHFFGAHFFNPPRYLKLLELIPGDDVDPAVFVAFRNFAEDTLGKGVVVCKDRPNFIGNRIIAFAAMSDLRFIIENGYSIEEVDALTGPVVGRPNTATFRLLDVVGTDIMAHVANNLYPAVPDDESRETLRGTDILDRMVAAGKLGRKSGGGFYKESKQSGKREFWPLDLATLDYVPLQGTASIDAFIAATKKIKSLPERLRFMIQRSVEQPEDRAAALVAQTLLPTMAYAARRLPEIADSVQDVDSAMRWGFAHELGPFQAWDALGVAETVALMQQRDIAVPAWVTQMLAEGHTHFYRDGVAYNVATGRHEAPPRDERAIDLAQLKAEGKKVLGNEAASLIDLGDGVLCFELHSKGNSLGGPAIQILLDSIEELQQDRWVGLVVGNQGARFCAGMDLNDFAAGAIAEAWDDLNDLVALVQDAFMKLRYSPKPVVTAPFSHTLGGGCELAMHGAAAVAAAETYMGLPEVGVGVIPAWGGCKELNRRFIAEAARNGGDVLKGMQRAFENIGLAKIATSALEAKDLGYLRPTDRIIFNQDYLIGEAKREVLKLVRVGYTPPPRGQQCYALGRDGLAMLRVGVYQLAQAGYASPYDQVIADKLAYVLCGGDLSTPQWVDEEYIMQLEREKVLELGRDPRTLARGKHMLETKKPLRN